ncbi:MAG TPA: 4Fe-4S binding protein [Candidatus Acetothermia bacterium]|nr:4Fe-4S binding protein [Candidatus Acetothermia bacterium]
MVQTMQAVATAIGDRAGFVMGGFLCPTSTVRNVIPRFSTGYLLLFLVPVALSLVMGRVFCGYICPFGAAQELLHVRKLAVKIPSRWLNVLSKLRYVLLVHLVARVLVTGTAILQNYSPFKPLISWGETPLSIGVTALSALRLRLPSVLPAGSASFAAVASCAVSHPHG